MQPKMFIFCGVFLVLPFASAVVFPSESVISAPELQMSLIHI